MKRFTFSLQYLLDVHKAREKAAEQAMVQAMKEHADMERKVQSVQMRRLAKIKEVESIRGVVRRSDYSASIRHIGELQKEVERLKAAANKLLAKVEERRAALRKEMMSRKMLEKLGDKERADWEEMVRFEEQKVMDEVASGRFARQESAE
jgi:flagellar export protein FliJ